MNDLLIKALQRKSCKRPPVWLMRQAGRYMPEYQALRSKYTLWQLFHEPELAAQVSMLPIDLLDVDAAILFSDILVLAEAFGKKIVFPEIGGPFVSPFIEELSDIDSLCEQSIDQSLFYVKKTIEILKHQLQVPLIGFCAGPFTLASYMLEGAGKGNFVKTKMLMHSHPKYFAMLLEKITNASINYLSMQVKAGADAVQIFDSWANVLNQEQFDVFFLPYIKKMILALKELNVPVIVFCRDSHLFVDKIFHIQPAAISIDEKGNLKKIREILGKDITLQGNLCATFLKEASRDMVIEATKVMLESMHGDPGFIVNLGHGVLPATPLENVRVFVQTVKQYSF
jgi:uroporphyrinogen decarboxylase